jgi:hypothetical protein
VAFYSGARAILKVLDHLVEDGDYEGLHNTIARHGGAPFSDLGLMFGAGQLHL